MAGELGPSGIRVVCLRSDAIPEAVVTSHTGEIHSSILGERAGTTVEGMLAERASTGTLLKRLPNLVEVANFAAFVASDRERDYRRDRQPHMWLARGLMANTPVQATAVGDHWPGQETIVGVTSFGATPCVGNWATTNGWTYHSV